MYRVGRKKTRVPEAAILQPRDQSLIHFIHIKNNLLKTIARNFRLNRLVLVSLISKSLIAIKNLFIRVTDALFIIFSFGKCVFSMKKDSFSFYGYEVVDMDF